MQTNALASLQGGPLEARKINLVRFILDLQDEKTLTFLEHLFFLDDTERELEAEINMLRERLAEFRANPEVFFTLEEMLEEFSAKR